MKRRRRREQGGVHLRRSSRWTLVAFLAAVFVVKLIVMLQLKDHPLVQPEGGLDSLTYVHLAERVQGGDLALGPGLYFVSPLYIYFLALTHWIGGSFTFVRLVQIWLGTCAVWMVFLSAREWFGARAAWTAAAFAALTGVFTFYEILILQSALDTFLTSAALYSLTRALGPDEWSRPKTAGASRSSARSGPSAPERAELRERGEPSEPAHGMFAAIAGLMFGLQMLNRPNVGIAVAGVALGLLAIRRWRMTLSLTAGVALALVPVAARNAVVAHQFAVVSSQGGLNFYIGNNAAATGQYVAIPGVRANIEGQSEDTRRVAEQATGRPLTDVEVSSYFTTLALSWIRDQPVAAARLFVRKLALAFNRRHQWLDFSYPYYAHDAGSILWLLIVGPWLLVPLGFAGFACMHRQSTRGGFLVWAAFVPLYAFSVALFFVAERYRLPLFVPLCITSGAAAEALLRGLGRLRVPGLQLSTFGARPVLAPTALFIFGGILTAWPFHLNDGRYDERLHLAKVLMEERDFARAAAELEEAHRIDPSNSVAEFNLGLALVNDGRATDGVAHIRHAVDAGVPVEGARYALAAALLGVDRDEAATLLRTFVPGPKDTADSCYRVALLALNAGVPDVAERYVRRALELHPGWPEAEQLLQRLRS